MVSLLIHGVLKHLQVSGNVHIKHQNDEKLALKVMSGTPFGVDVSVVRC